MLKRKGLKGSEHFLTFELRFARRRDFDMNPWHFAAFGEGCKNVGVVNLKRQVP